MTPQEFMQKQIIRSQVIHTMEAREFYDHMDAMFTAPLVVGQYHTPAIFKEICQQRHTRSVGIQP